MGNGEIGDQLRGCVFVSGADLMFCVGMPIAISTHPKSWRQTMNSISNLPGYQTGGTAHQNTLPDLWAGTYEKTQALSVSESLASDLTIRTNEGDVVTLSRSSFTRLDSLLYDSRGVLRTEAGTAVSSRNYREVTLASGKTLSFSVQGDLNEEELQDIEAIVKGVDAIISDLMKNDAEGALGTALSMGRFESISGYAADIGYRRIEAFASDTRVSTATSSQAAQELPGEKKETDPVAREKAEPKFLDTHARDRFMKKLDKFLDKMIPKLLKRGEKGLKKAEKVIDRLFKHHLDKISGDEKHKSSRHEALEEAGKRVRNMFEHSTNKSFTKRSEGDH